MRFSNDLVAQATFRFLRVSAAPLTVFTFSSFFFLPSHPRSSNLFEDNMGANVTKASPICWLAWYGAKSIKPTFEFNVSWTSRVTHRAHLERCHQREPGVPQTSGVTEARRARRPTPTWVGGPPPSPGRPKGRGIRKAPGVRARLF